MLEQECELGHVNPSHKPRRLPIQVHRREPDPVWEGMDGRWNILGTKSRTFLTTQKPSFQTSVLSRAIWNPAKMSRGQSGVPCLAFSPLQGQRHGSHGMTVWWDSSLQRPALSRAIWNPAQLAQPQRGSMSRLFAFASAKARFAWNDGVVGLVIAKAALSRAIWNPAKMSRGPSGVPCLAFRLCKRKGTARME